MQLEYITIPLSGFVGMYKKITLLSCWLWENKYVYGQNILCLAVCRGN